MKIILLSFLIASIITSYPLQEKHKSKLPSKSIDERVVASVGKLKITADELKKGYDFGPAFYKREKKSKDIYLKFLINEKLLAQDGYNRRVDTVKQVVDMFKVFHDDLITDELYNDEIFSKIKAENKEIDSVITQKQLELSIKWIYTQNKEEAISCSVSLHKGASFDSLFIRQSSDSSVINNRKLITSLFDLKKNNPVMAKILDTLKAGNVSLPIHAFDGWYLIKLEDISRNIITTESDENELRSESIEAVKMTKMNRLSDQYIYKLMSSEKPVIRKNEFSILRSFIGNHLLPKSKFENWHLAEKMDSALSVLSIKDKEKIPLLTVVDLKNSTVTLADVLNWFWTRDQYIKFNENDLLKYSVSFEQMIWRMVRDKVLVAEADKRNISGMQSVKNQERWWRDKIVYSYVRNELANEVSINNNELPSAKNDADQLRNSDKLSFELSKKILYKINMLKQKISININSDVLNSINVTEENDPKAIELYIVKKGGLIPRTPFPAIDNDWKSWE